MSKKLKKREKQLLITNRHKTVEELADKYKWSFVGGDRNTYKVSYIDSMGIYRADVYLSTLSVGLLPIGAGLEMKWFKKIDYKKIEDILKSPTKYEIG
jgi:hypothetical protein